MPAITSKLLIEKLMKQLFQVITSNLIAVDDGSHLPSSKSHEFIKKRVTSSSNHHKKNNGKAESAVKVMKHLIRKCFKEEQTNW